MTASVDALHRIYGFNREFVGISFLDSEESYRTNRLQELRHPLSYCSAVRLACSGRARKITRETISCPGALRALGMTVPDEEFTSGRRYLSLGMYRDQETARQVSAQVSLLERPVNGLALEPLSHCSSPPDVVLIICNAFQAMRLVQGHVHGRGEPVQAGIFGMQGVCAELTVRPHLTNRPVVSLLCSNTRFSCAWEDGELGVGLPFPLFEAMAGGVLETLNSAESDQRKQGLRARAAEVPGVVEITNGSAYYVNGTVTAKEDA